MKNLDKQINWGKGDGLAPAIIQEAATGAILMLGYMNRQSLVKTLKTKKVWFYSRSKQRLWMKGESSGNVLKLIEIKPDCDYDALLIKAKPADPTCHKGKYSCFGDNQKAEALSSLFKIVEDRKKNLPQNSYTTSLFKDGLDKICLKVAEEALEVVQAARKETKPRLIEEAVDLIYHLFVLLADKNIGIEKIQQEIARRSKAAS